MSRFSKGCWIALGTLVLSSAVVLGAKLRESGLWVVEEESENFRDSPNGRKLGTLVEGVEIEQVERDGEWVRFRLEGWIWGGRNWSCAR